MYTRIEYAITYSSSWEEAPWHSAADSSHVNVCIPNLPFPANQHDPRQKYLVQTEGNMATVKKKYYFSTYPTTPLFEM